MQHKQFVYADGKLIALNTQVKDSAHKLKDKQVRYLHYDALDSVDMITDGFGKIVERRSFDPWGKMRSVIWEDDSVTNIAQQLITNRGFTGHEHIEEVGLIHMNGRVYDQELGRFLSADPMIQAPFMTNSFNRYSYVMNNPLKYTDPTGFRLTESGDNDGGRYTDHKGNHHEGADSRRGNGSKGPNHPDNDPTKPTAGSGEIATEQEIADLGLEDGRVVNSIDSLIDNFFSVTDNYQETAQSVLDADLKTKLKAFAGVTLEMSVTTFVGKFKALKPVADAVTNIGKNFAGKQN